MKNLLILHQSAELYGSDKTILLFITHLDRSRYNPIVVLPFEGPLKTELEKHNITVILAPVLKLYRKMFTVQGLKNFYNEYRVGLRILEELHERYRFDLVYSHTLAALIGLVFARKHGVKHLWHVQEILAKPAFVNWTFKRLLTLQSNHQAIYDSEETMKFWIKDEPQLAAKSHFIWNALDVKSMQTPTAAEVANVRKEVFKVDDQTVVIGLVGRINSWKGQPLLLDAFKILEKKYTNIRLVFIGAAPPNQEFFETDLRAKIALYGLESKVNIVPFQLNIHPYWAAIDIAVVPSTEPEPFGMVAIEAMYHQKPVVAANHGGLTEIVVPDKTGYLFQNNKAESLAEYIEKLIQKPELRHSMGQSGKERVHSTFSMEHHMAEFEKIFDKLLK